MLSKLQAGSKQKLMAGATFEELERGTVIFHEQLEKLNPKGHSFFHIDAINEDFSCNNCHTGAFPKE